MCEASAYLIRNGEEVLVMESVDILRPENGNIYLQGIFGDRQWVKGRIKEMNLVDHRIVLVED